MNRIIKGKLAVVALAVCSAFIACGGGGGGSKAPKDPPVITPTPPPPVTESEFDYYVDGNAGSDEGVGSEKEPFRTITNALDAAHRGQSIKVSPGTYDAAHGEVFPLMVTEGMTLTGGEVEGASPVIEGAGDFGRPPFTATIFLSGPSILSGFVVTNPLPLTRESKPVGILVTGSKALISDNKIRSNNFAGILCAGDATGASILGNQIERNHLGIQFDTGSSGIVEENIFQGNDVGVQIYEADVNLGGPRDCRGGNLFSHNQQDLYLEAEAGQLYAMDNYWDQIPLTSKEVGKSSSRSVILTDGAKNSADYPF